MATAAQLQMIIRLEVGDERTDEFPSGILAANMELFWDSYADKAQVAPRLQELYCRRRCIDVVLGVVRGQVTYSIDNDHSFNGSDKAKRLLEMREATQTEIDKAEKESVSQRGGAVGQLSTQAPVSPPYGPPDANHPAYSGSPYYRPLDPYRRS